MQVLGTRERRWFRGKPKGTLERERRWFVLQRPRRDTNGGSETEVTVTSKLQANAERNKEIEKRQKREEKAASFGGAVRGSEPEDELSEREQDANCDSGYLEKQKLMAFRECLHAFVWSLARVQVDAMSNTATAHA